MHTARFPNRRPWSPRMVQPVVAVAVWSLLQACAELSPDPPRQDIAGCYRIDLEGAGESRAPAPPAGVELTDRPFLDRSPTEHDLSHYRFDARAAKTAYLLYADTAFHVAWWWASEPERRFGVGNHNRFAAFYIDAVVRGERLEGEMRRWRYGENDEPVAGPDTWVAPLTGRRTDCAAPVGARGD